ncbi:MAG TPA: hypothetical protein VJQ54_11440 [Candidatus Sulfotelmatobacter sp.]|nr:hypothetical protein [Candidatus Sulfotelmatobacter sp.]
MDSGVRQPQVRFDARAERAEYQYLFEHPARVLQDRLARLGGGDRSKQIGIPEWKRVYLREEQDRKLLHQARALGWGREKQYYYTQKVA